MKKYKHKHKKKTGFTVIELLIAIGIIVVISAIIFAFLSNSRAKAADARTQETLGTVRTVATEDKITQESFESTFADGGRAYEVVEELAKQQGLVAGEYAYHASPEAFVVAFPLKAQSGYWCVDAEGISKKVEGLPVGSEPYHCGNVVASGGGASSDDEEGEAPEITLVGGSPYYTGRCEGSFCIPPAYSEPGYEALDAEDGDLTAAVTVDHYYCQFGGGICQAQYSLPCGEVVEFIERYRVTDSDGNTTEELRVVRDTQCLPW